MKGEKGGSKVKKMKEKHKEIKKIILENYCQMKRGLILAELRTKLDDDVIIQLLDDFSGRLIYIPTKSSLRRAALPMLIEQELKGIEPGSSEFKIKVKNLSQFYKLTQKAIKTINRKGIYTR